MTLDQKIGQLFVVPVCPEHGEDHLIKVRNLIKERYIGGVILMQGTSQRQREVIEVLQNEQVSPLLTFQDAEWGIGMRLRDVPQFPKNLTLGAIQDLNLLRLFGLELARQCRYVGIQGNFAPVVDVNSNPKNPVIHQRSFGEDPRVVAKHALAVMQGMQAGGILACAKHFPGHGDTAIDSHLNLPIIDKSLSALENLELIPFKALIKGGVDLVMTGHLLLPAISSEPSSISFEMITNLLRTKLGFDGLVITDSLHMKAIAQRYSLDEIAVKALLAGSDLLLVTTHIPQEVSYLIETAIPEAIDRVKATIPEELIDAKIERIMRVKERIIPPIPLEEPNLRRTLYRHALTQIGRKIEMGDEIALVQSRPDPDFQDMLSRYAKLVIFSYEEMELAQLYPSIIVNVRKGDSPMHIPKHALVALFDSPYVLNHLDFKSSLVGYEDVIEAKEALSDALFGKLTPLGKLPIRLLERNDQ